MSSGYWVGYGAVMCLLFLYIGAMLWDTGKVIIKELRMEEDDQA